MSEDGADGYEIRHGDATAVIGSLGGSLLDFRMGGHRYAHSQDVRHPERSVPSAGNVLVPWPNRTAGGRWTDQGRVRHLEVTEPGRGHAIHGLVADRHWTPVEHARSHITLECAIAAQQGWPVPLHTTVRYEVGACGLSVVHRVDNVGERAIPFGLGVHPYLLPGPYELSDCELTLQASGVMPADPDTKLPSGIHHVRHTGYDFRRGRPLREVPTGSDLDNTFGRCRAGRGGVIRHSLTRGNGEGVELWTGRAFRWVHAFRWLPEDPPGMAVAIEPMTCPPDALNSGTDLITLRPGASWHAGWGIRPLVRATRSPS